MYVYVGGWRSNKAIKINFQSTEKIVNDDVLLSDECFSYLIFIEFSKQDKLAVKQKYCCTFFRYFFSEDHHVRFLLIDEIIFIVYEYYYKNSSILFYFIPSFF